MEDDQPGISVPFKGTLFCGRCFGLSDEKVFLDGLESLENCMCEYCGELEAEVIHTSWMTAEEIFQRRQQWKRLIHEQESQKEDDSK